MDHSKNSNREGQQHFVTDFITLNDYEVSSKIPNIEYADNNVYNDSYLDVDLEDYQKAINDSNLVSANVCAPENISLSGNNSSCHDISEWDVVIEFVFHGVLLNFVGILGLVGNLLSIFILSRPQMKGSTNCILIGLATYDSILIITSILMFGIPAVYRYTESLFSFYKWEVFPYITPCVYAIGLNAQTTSAYLTLCVTLERYVAVCQPLKARSICTYGRARKSVIILGIASLVYNIPRFLEVTWTTNLIDGMNRTEPIPTMMRMDPTYINVYTTWMYLVVMNIFPFTCLAVFNLQIYFQIRKANHERAKLSRLQQREIGLATMLICVVIVFFACNILAVVNNVLEVFHVCEGGSKRCTALTQVSNLLVTLNSSVNFIIYCIYGEKFKRLFCFYFCKTCGGGREENQHLQRYTTTRGITTDRCHTYEVTTTKSSASYMNNTTLGDVSSSKLKVPIHEVRNANGGCEESAWKRCSGKKFERNQSQMPMIDQHAIIETPNNAFTSKNDIRKVNETDYSGLNTNNETAYEHQKDAPGITPNVLISNSDSMETETMFLAQNGIPNTSIRQIKDASTNTKRRRPLSYGSASGVLRQHVKSCQIETESKCAVCVHDKLCRSNSTNTAINYSKCKKCCIHCSTKRDNKYVKPISNSPVIDSFNYSNDHCQHLLCNDAQGIGSDEDKLSALTTSTQNGLEKGKTPEHHQSSLKNTSPTPKSESYLLIGDGKYNMTATRSSKSNENLLTRIMPPTNADNLGMISSTSSGRSSLTSDGTTKASTVKTSSSRCNSNCIRSKRNLVDIQKGHSNPLSGRDINGHAYNKQRELNDCTFPTAELKTPGPASFSNLCPNLSATKITMSSSQTGEETNTIINIIYTEDKVSNDGINSERKKVRSQSSILEENKEEKLLREQFENFQKSKRSKELLEKDSCNPRNTSNLRRRSFHRLEPNKTSHSDNANFSSVLHPTYNEQDVLFSNTSHVCKIKSNSIPRSAVERKQRRKRTKMAKKMENKLANSSVNPLNSENLLIPLPLTTFISDEPTSTVLFSSKNFVSKANNDRVVYL